MSEVLELARKKTGEVLRELRRNANASIKEFYGTIISKQYAYRIESNLQNISRKKLNMILKRQNILIDEFTFIQNNFIQNDLEKIIDQFFAIENTLEVEKIKDLLEILNKKIKKDSSFFYECLSQILNAYLILNETHQLDSLYPIIKPVWNKLAKKDQWTYCDLVLVCNIVYVFDISNLDSMIQRLFKELKRYRHFKNVNQLELKVWFNYCMILRLNGRMLETKSILKKLLKKAESKHDSLLICECKFRLAEISWIQKTENEELLHNRARRVVVTLLYLRQDKIAKDLVSDWKNRTGYELENITINDEVSTVPERMK